MTEASPNGRPNRLEQLRRVYERMPSAFEPLILNFVNNCRVLLERLDQALAQERAEDLQRAAHSLKSSSGMLECQESYRLSMLLEELGRTADFEAARRELPLLKEAMERELKSVAEWLQANPL